MFFILICGCLGSRHSFCDFSQYYSFLVHDRSRLCHFIWEFSLYYFYLFVVVLWHAIYVRTSLYLFLFHLKPRNFMWEFNHYHFHFIPDHLSLHHFMSKFSHYHFYFVYGRSWSRYFSVRITITILFLFAVVLGHIILHGFFAVIILHPFVLLWLLFM